MDNEELGRRLRGRRAALGRTVASVATQAGLSVPYVANLENGRGNPTVSALDRLAAALGTRLVVELADEEITPAPPPSLIAFSAGKEFRREAARLAELTGRDHRVELLAALAAVSHALGKDLSERDWQRLLDALALVIMV